MYGFAVIGLALLPLAAYAACDINEKMIDAVKSGKVVTAKASWWGFDPEDSTGALQAAIDSGAKRVIVDNLGKPWIVRPIKLASDQEVVFEPGVEVLAKPDEFKGTNDCLFKARNAKNITLTGRARLRMRRADYAKPPYEKGEWRHVLSFCSCSNVRVEGLTLAESGGDGVYLGTATKGVTNKDITIKDVICDSNYRQGISVITAENLLIENTIMRNTAGTNPQSGIDFEPNGPTECLKNIVMRNCRTENNAGQGYQFYLNFMDATSEPVSVRFEDCVSANEAGSSAWVSTGNEPKQAVSGKIEFVDCVFDGAASAAASVGHVPPGGCRVRFENCRMRPAQGAVAPIVIRSGARDTRAVGGVEFVNCVVPDRPGRKPLVYTNGGKVPLQGVSGTLIVESDGARQKVELAPELLNEWTAAGGAK